MAVFLRRLGLGQYALALTVVPLDAAWSRASYRGAGGESTYRPGCIEATFRLGIISWIVLQRLQSLFFDCLAAILLGPRASFLYGHDGESWGRRVPHASRIFDGMWPDRRPLDRCRCLSNKGTQDFYDCRVA